MKNMIKIALPWRDGKTSFKLLPIDINCPFLEIRFNYTEKSLNVMSKVKYQLHKMYPKLDENGQATYKPGKVPVGQQPILKEERKLADAFYDYIITEKSDIIKFIDLMTGELNDLEKYFIPEVKLPTPEQQEAMNATNGKDKGPKLTITKE